MNKKIIIFSIIGGLLLLIVAVGGTLAFLRFSPWTSGLFTHAAQASEPAKEVSKKPLFKPLEKFVISIDGDNGRRYLMLDMTLVTHSQDQLGGYDDYMPVIRNSLVQYFSLRNETQLNDELHHIDKLELDLQERLCSTLSNYGFKPAIDEVLITKYVVQ